MNDELYWAAGWFNLAEGGRFIHNSVIAEFIIPALSTQRPTPVFTMIIPCIDLMDRKVVQLVQGKEKFLELPEPLAVLEKFSAYPEIQVIDLDAAMGKAENNAEIVRELCRRKPCRVGGGIRSTARAQAVRGRRSAESHCGQQRLHLARASIRNSCVNSPRPYRAKES